MGKSDTSVSVASPSKRLGRKSKESATVYLNMVAQNLTKKPSKSDDEISVESFSEATQKERLEEVKASVASAMTSTTSSGVPGSNTTTSTTSVTSPPSAPSSEKRKVKYKERKIITPTMPIAPAA